MVLRTISIEMSFEKKIRLERELLSSAIWLLKNDRF